MSLSKFILQPNLQPAVLQQKLRYCNVDQKDEDGYTLLHTSSATLFNYVFTRVILDAGADPNIPDPGGDNLAHILTFVIAHEPTDWPTCRPMQILKLLCEHRLNINARNLYGDCAVHMAATYANPQLIGCRIQLGANSSLRNSRNQTTLELLELYS